MANFFGKIGKQLHDHAKLWLWLVAIITVVLVFGLSKIKLNTSNSLFINNSSKLYKDSNTYQKKFGSDPFIIDLRNNKGGSTIDSTTFKRVNEFANKTKNISGLRISTNIVNLLNAELNSKSSASMLNSSGGASNKQRDQKLQKDLMANLSTAQKQKLQRQISGSLNNNQKQKVQKFTISILTPQQKSQMAQAQKTGKKMNSSALTRGLNSKQQQQVQAYNQSVLNPKQKSQLASSIQPMLPKAQNMTTALLQDMIFSNNGKMPGQLGQVLPKNGKHLLIQIPTGQGATLNSNQKQYNKINHYLKQAGLKKNGYKASIAGQPSIAGTISPLMTGSMATMGIIAVIVMFVILMLVFPVRRRLLPLLTVILGMVWTFGLMGWTGIDITLATMATLPILIGVGTDFGVQLVNRYEEEFRNNGHKPREAVIQTYSHSGSAVGIAVLVMIISFLTMMISKAPMIKQFGVTLAFGAFLCFVIESLVTLPYISIRDRKVSEASLKKKGLSNSWLNRELGKYANVVMHHAGVITLVGIVLAGLGFFFENKLSVETNILNMVPQNMKAIKSTNHVNSIISGSTNQLTYLVKNKNGNQATSKSSLQEIKKFQNKEADKYSSKIESTRSITNNVPTNILKTKQPRINSVISNIPNLIKNNLISTNKKYATITFMVDPDLSTSNGLKLMNHITNDAKNLNHIKASPAGTQAELYTGINNISSGREAIMIAGLAAIFVILLLVYRHFRYSIYPLIPIVIVLGLSPLTLKILGMGYNPVTIALSPLVLGIGTEFTVLMLERYIEERRKKYSNQRSIQIAMGSVGQAITASGLTVVAGFAAMLFVSFPVLKDFGLITVLDTAYSLIATLTILPAIIYLLRPKSQRKNKQK